MIGLITFPTHMFYSVDDRKDYPIHLLLCKALHHCHSSGLVCRARGISFSVSFRDLFFSHHVAFKNLILKHHDRLEPTWWPLWRSQPVALRTRLLAGFNPAQQPLEIWTPYHSVEIVILLRITQSQSWRHRHFFQSYSFSENVNQSVKSSVSVFSAVSICLEWLKPYKTFCFGLNVCD